MKRTSINPVAIIAILAMIGFFTWVIMAMAGARPGSRGTDLVIKIAIGFGAAAIGLGIGTLLSLRRRKR